MVAPWQQMVFSEQAQFLVEQFEGLTEDDLDAIYSVWETKKYPDGISGRTEALNDLMLIAQRRQLEKHGKMEQYDNYVEDEIRRLGQGK